MAHRTAPARQNLPQEPDGFIGRERDLSDLLRLLAADRALTLCGIRGIGKTRLALRVAAHATGSFQDGVWLAEMAGVTGPAEIAARVAGAVGVTEEPWRPLRETLCDALRTSRVLLVLDDCGHVAKGVADLASALVETCPGLSVLATSTEPVGIPGEAIWRVPPLTTPASPSEDDPQASEAVRLFAARTVPTGTEPAGTAPSAERTASAARICRAVDGVPFAVELVAAWLPREGAPGGVEERLTACLRESGATGAAVAPGPGPAPRSRILTEVLEETLAGLTDDERVLLRRLSVFGDWSLEAAEQVCSGGPLAEEALLDLVSSLAERSLIALTRESQGRVRYRLPGAVRARAAELLAGSGEREAVRLRHRAHVLRIAEALGTAAVEGRLVPWAERFTHWRSVRADYDEMRTALHWSAARGDTEEGLRLCVGLRPYWGTGYHFTEGSAWNLRFLAMPGGTAAVRARAEAGTAELAWAGADHDSAVRHARAALELADACGDHATAGAVLNMLALVALRDGEPEAAAAHVARVLPAAREHGHLWNEAIALSTQGALYSRHGNFSQAESLYNAALMILRGLDHRWGVGVCLIAQATVAERQGDLAGADRCYRESLDIQRAIGAAPELARCLYGVGRVAYALGSTDQAYDYLAEGLRLSVSTGQLIGVAVGLRSIALVAAGNGETHEACVLAGAALALRERAEPGRKPGPAALSADSAGAGTDPAAAAAWEREGRLMPAEEATALALAITETRRVPRRRPAPRTAVRPSPAPPAPPEPHRGLTPREIEVAHLVAGKLGNRDIARRLSIATTTVARHLANIHRKLGFSSREQIAAWVTRHEASE